MERGKEKEYAEYHVSADSLESGTTFHLSSQRCSKIRVASSRQCLEALTGPLGTNSLDTTYLCREGPSPFLCTGFPPKFVESFVRSTDPRWISTMDLEFVKAEKTREGESKRGRTEKALLPSLDVNLSQLYLDRWNDVR